MAGPNQVFKNLNLYFDSQSYAGSIVEFTPPKIASHTEEHRSGGMDAPVKLTLGTQALDTEFTLINFDPALFTSISPVENVKRSFVAREAYEDWDGRVHARTITMRGKVISIDEGSHAAGQKAQLKISMSLDYYKDEVDGSVVQEIDVINMVWNQKGKNALATIASALGIA